MKKQLVASQLMAALLAIPMSTPKGWHSLKFRHIPPNQISFSEGGLKIDVDKSANPLVYVLPQPELVQSFHVKLDVHGQLHSSATNTKWCDDAYLRVGFVVPGQHRLSTIEHWFAADWIKKLYALAPHGLGLDKVYFFDLDGQKATIGQTRTVPHSHDLIQETVAAIRRDDQDQVTLDYRLPTPRLAYALWLSSDGDNTQSKFHLLIRSLNLSPVRK